MMRLPCVVLTLMLATFADGTAAAADVISSAPGGLVVRSTVEVAATPEAVYDALTAGVSDWWPGSQTWSGNSRNLSIDARAGGCFCEKLSNGGSVQIMQVVFAERGALLRLSGSAPGPLQASAAIATQSWQLTKVGAGTRIELTFSLAGYLAVGFDKIAPATDKVFADLLNSLAKHVTPKP